MPAAPIPLERLCAVPDELWRSLGAAIERSQALTTHEPLWALSDTSFEPTLRALKLAALRRDDDAAARVLRAFWMADPVPPAALGQALGDELVAQLVRAGVLIAHDGGLVSPLLLVRHGQSFLLAEDLRRGADAVMGAGALTRSLARAALRDEGLDSVLDLGCGAGAISLSLAPSARRVLATDVNPRAVALCRANLALHGVVNVEARSGDLFDAAAGETFDCVLFQPPFVASTRSAGDATFAVGGARGDEIARRALAEVPGHLRAGGLAIFAAELPLGAGQSLHDALEGAVPPSANLLIIDHGGMDAATFAVGYAAYLDPHYGPSFDRIVLEHSATLERLGVIELRTVTLIVTLAPSESGWLQTFSLARSPQARLEQRDVRALLRSFEHIAAGPEAIAAARVQLRPDAQLARLPDGRALVHAPAVCPIAIEGIGPQSARLLDAVRGARSVGDGLRKIAKEQKNAPARGDLLAGVQQLLACGLLEIA